KEAWDHRVEKVVVERTVHGGAETVGRVVEPELADPFIDRSRQQEPDALHIACGGADERGVYVVTAAEKVHAAHDIVGAHRRQIATDRVRAGVGQPVSEVRTVVKAGGRVARLEFEDDGAFSDCCDRERRTRAVLYKQERRFATGGAGKV